MPGVEEGAPAGSLTGGFDVCLQLSAAAVDTIVTAFDAAAPPGSPLRLLRAVLADRLALFAGVLSPGTAPLVTWLDGVPGAVAAYANGAEAPVEDAPVEGAVAFLEDDDGFAIALAPEFVEAVVRREIVRLCRPSQFEVRLKGPRGVGLVRWQVTLDWRSTGTVLHPGGAPGPGFGEVPEAVLLSLRGSAVARGLGSLYADLDFTFEVLVPFAPEVSEDDIAFLPGEAQFRLLHAPIALEAFRGTIATNVGQQLATLREEMLPPALRLGQLTPLLGQQERALHPAFDRAGLCGGALVLRGSVHIESDLTTATTRQAP